jgi:hypothetical protein
MDSVIPSLSAIILRFDTRALLQFTHTRLVNKVQGDGEVNQSESVACKTKLLLCLQTEGLPSHDRCPDNPWLAMRLSRARRPSYHPNICGFIGLLRTSVLRGARARTLCLGRYKSQRF